MLYISTYRTAICLTGTFRCLKNPGKLKLDRSHVPGPAAGTNLIIEDGSNLHESRYF